MGIDVIPAVEIKELILADKGTISTDFTANGTANVTISNVAPAAVTTATISAWLQIKNKGGTSYYIPVWT